MENGLSLAQVEHYIDKVLPKIEEDLKDSSKSPSEKLDLYNLYEEVLRVVAPYNFMAFNTYLELDEDHNSENHAFYYHRKDHIGEIFEALNDMEMYDKYDILLISMPPRVGKTTTGIRFLAWISGKYPLNTELAISYADSVTTSFYNGVMEIARGERFLKVFPRCGVVNQNAKREEIWLAVNKRYPTISFIPIGGSMTGRAEASKYLYCDDLVSGIEEAMSPTRLDKLWSTYTVNAKQRKKDGCKEIHVATRWSVHDPITKLSYLNKDNPRCKVITVSCYDENGESNFDFKGGFSTAYYKEIESTMDEISFGALYKQQPIEREGLLYHDEDLQFYFKRPAERPDTIIGICDSKNLGKDYVSAIVGYVYGDFIYVEDVVYNNGLPGVTRPLVANLYLRHNVVRADVEMNNGGNYYAEDLEELINAQNGNTSLRIFYSGNNKITKIITYSDYVKKHFIFKHPSQYSKNSEYAKFMQDLKSWTQTGNNAHDDAPDSVAMMAQLKQDIETTSIKIVDRRKINA